MKPATYYITLLRTQNTNENNENTYLKSLYGNIIIQLKNVGELYSPSLYYPIQAVIVSNEDINVGDQYIYRKELYLCVAPDELTSRKEDCKKLIGMASQHIMDKLVLGELKEGDEVEMELQPL